MKKNKIMTAILLSGLLLISNIISIAAVQKQYVPEDAVQYAEENWDNGVGVCDEYVKECLEMAEQKVYEADEILE